jgi:GNAT superfamily N-acetyltransferase
MSTVLPLLALEEVTHPAEDPFAALNAMLNEYNVGHVGPANHVPLWLFARDTAGKVQGGLRGQTYWSWCTIDVLAVAEPYRSQGIGSRLLAKAEEIAQARGCVGVRLFGSTPQASKHPVSTTGTDIPNLAASKVIRRVIAESGS